MTLDDVLAVVTVAMLVATTVTGVVAVFRVGLVHKCVLQDGIDRMNYQRALIRALQDKGITVPIDQSAPVPPGATDR